jgi:hypothetical protein
VSSEPLGSVKSVTVKCFDMRRSPTTFGRFRLPRIGRNSGRHFFVRACLDIPVHDSSLPFTWGVWVSLSEAHFREMADRWEDPERAGYGPYFGWLCTAIPEYPDTMFLKTMVHNRAVGTRPAVELEPTDHPLAVHQREGISESAMRRIVESILHEGPGRLA